MREPRELIDTVVHPVAQRISALLAGDEPGMILVDDDENIAQAAGAGVHFESLYFAGEEQLSAQTLALISTDVPLYEIKPRTCKKIFEKDRFSRAFAIAERPPELSIEQLLGGPIRDDHGAGSGDILVLDRLSISGNIGSIVRSALALGARGIVLVDCEQVTHYDRRLIRASRGYLFHLPMVATDASTCIERCKQQGVPLIVTDATAVAGLDGLLAAARPAAIVLGSEKEGVSEELVRAADLAVHLPMSPAVESLNVSAAAAIVLFARYRKSEAI